MKWKVGDHVTCKHAVEAYYSNYGPRPKMLFRPGMVGTVTAIAPKVCLPRKGYRLPPELDRNPFFLVVDYPAPETARTERVGLNGLNVCNARHADKRVLALRRIQSPN